MTLRIFFHHLLLGFHFAKQELKERYIGTSFGQLWLLISPVVTIFIYTVIFSDFMQMKLGLHQNRYSYSLYLIPGLLSWNFFVSLISRLSNSILDKAPILKKINIPMYVYYIAIFLSEFFVYSIAMAFGVLFVLFVGGDFSFVLLVCMLLLAVFAFSLGVIFSLFVPFFKDLREMIQILLQLWFWVTPIIYVKEMIAHKLPWLLSLNILYYFIEPMQEIFLYGTVHSATDCIASAIIALLALLVAMALYKRLISAIKDIL